MVNTLVINDKSDMVKELELLEKEISRLDGLKLEYMHRASLIMDKLADLGEELHQK